MIIDSSDSSCIFDPCVVPYYELVIRDPNYKGIIRVPFNLESWKRQQENITANQGLHHADTTANSSLQCDNKRL